jgi:phosphorylase kinase alpha/beta subunit
LNEFYLQKIKVLIKTEDGLRLVPELYAVPSDKVPEEYKCPGSQERVPLGRCPFMWAQSLFIIGRLLQEVQLAIDYVYEIDWIQ